MSAADTDRQVAPRAGGPSVVPAPRVAAQQEETRQPAAATTALTALLVGLPADRFKAEELKEAETSPAASARLVERWTGAAKTGESPVGLLLAIALSSGVRTKVQGSGLIMELEVLRSPDGKRTAVTVMIAHHSGDPKLVRSSAQLPEKTLPIGAWLHLGRSPGTGEALFFRLLNQ